MSEKVDYISASEMAELERDLGKWVNDINEILKNEKWSLSANFKLRFLSFGDTHSIGLGYDFDKYPKEDDVTTYEDPEE